MKKVHDLTKKLKPFMESNFLLAVSGGLDSMALFHLFLHFRSHFSVKFAVAHCHHGQVRDPLQNDFRYNAQEFVRKICVENEVPFFTNSVQTQSQVQSENELRNYRYEFFNTLLSENAFDFLVFGHHRDDLLETRMLRLIRGVGPENLKSMEFQSGHKLRPLLNWSREELKEFLTAREGGWLEDPSNEQQGPLRNWLRKKWFKDLEDKVPGGVQTLARSIDLLVQCQSQSVEYDSIVDAQGVIISELFGLGREEKAQVLARYMKSQGLKNYGVSHINEILKRLDTEQKRLSFSMLGHRWLVDAGRMKVERSS